MSMQCAPACDLPLEAGAKLAEWPVEDDRKTFPRNGQFTREEIWRQPSLWPDTVQRVQDAIERWSLKPRLQQARVLLTGAGTSYYASAAIAAVWPRAKAIPTTDLLVNPGPSLFEIDTVISIARTGDSPESRAIVELVRELRPDILQLAIVCNEDSALARSAVDRLIALHPLTNDRSLVATSAFSNQVIAGQVLAQTEGLDRTVRAFGNRSSALLPELDAACERAASRISDRFLVLSSPPLGAWRRESGLKLLEMTAGRFPVLTESYLGLRHGPMSFVKPDTVVLCLLSNDRQRRAYEIDLIHELRAKKIGYLVGIAEPADSKALFDQTIPAVSPELEDALRTPYEIVSSQMIGYRTSMRIGLNPDNPSPEGVITRVVQGVRIHTGM